MKVIKTISRPNLPDSLKPLEIIANDLWLSWNFEAVMLFIRLDYDNWVNSGQNPVRLLGMVGQERLEELSKDDSFLAALNSVYENYTKYIKGETWYKGEHKDIVAYFSMEYGMDVSLPIYSGGLGILSGDHMKTSSDLGLPLIGIGLLYRQGYFSQYLNADGYQQESYPENDWYNMPVKPLYNQHGERSKISVEIGDAIVIATIWEVKVGRNSLYLLDTNIDENSPANRLITSALYGGDKEMRIKQEVLLGIGGYRAAKVAGYNPAVTHMNEGHAAFQSLERIRELVKESKLTIAEAIQAIWPTNIFTTHTPVPAGNERFSIDLMEKYMKPFATDIGFDWEGFLALGRVNTLDQGETFCMTVLALKLSAYANGVSQLHGVVSREMWKGIWPELPMEEIPIGAITNGVHPRTWLSHNMTDLLDRYFGPRFNDDPANLEIWDRINRLSDEELWRTHDRRRERLVVFARERYKYQLQRRGATRKQLAMAEDILSPYNLTISFARRFATYKRATLLFREPDRLIKLLTDPDRPIQMIFAGKAHPHDIPGKELIKEIVHFSNRPDVRGKIIFLEDYDVNIAKYMVSGSDVWLNTPRRPLEASGTSGMKAAINGVLNCSVLDGWWAEAQSPSNGWAIGSGEEYDDEELQDEIESKALYDLLEREIIPIFYDRGRDQLPRGWISMMKHSIHDVGKNFCSHRMLKEYAETFYYPALENHKKFFSDNFGLVKNLASWHVKTATHWNEVAITELNSAVTPVIKAGDSVEVTAKVKLGTLKPEDVMVEIFTGPISLKNDAIERAERFEMSVEKEDHGIFIYKAKITTTKTGQLGYSARILPKHKDLIHNFLPGLIKWA